jgi:hypothetical protein
MQRQKCTEHGVFALKNALQRNMQTGEAFCLRVPRRCKTASSLSTEANLSSSFLFLPPPFGSRDRASSIGGGGRGDLQAGGEPQLPCLSTKAASARSAAHGQEPRLPRLPAEVAPAARVRSAAPAPAGPSRVLAARSPGSCASLPRPRPPRRPGAPLPRPHARFVDSSS